MISSLTLINPPGAFVRIIDADVLQAFYGKLPDFYFQKRKGLPTFDSFRKNFIKAELDGIMDDEGNLLHSPSSPRLVIEYLRSITPGFYNRSYRKHMPRPAILDKAW